ncbi:MAG: glycosyltransferase [Pseudomonadota bacterium]
MNHDVIDDRYARLYELPACLSEHIDVSAVCVDYRLGKMEEIHPDLRAVWRRTNIPRSLFLGWLFSLLFHARKYRPNVVVASSDCLQVILGRLVARMLGVPFIADLYDDYATFGLAKLPAMRRLYRKSLAGADGIIAVSETLGADLREAYPETPVLILESTIDADRFQPRDKDESRALLGLQQLDGKKLVGVCGGLNAFHGADTVFSVFPLFARQHPDVMFVVAGTLYEDCPLPDLENVTYLGMLPHDRMSHFFSALDVMIIALSNTRFGYYAFPQKAYEVLACRVPAVAADVGALAELFSSLPDARYDADSPASLAKALNHQLRGRGVLDVRVPTWKEQAKRLADYVIRLQAD